MSRSDDRPNRRRPVGAEAIWRDSTKLANTLLHGEEMHDFEAPGAVLILTWIAA